MANGLVRGKSWGGLRGARKAGKDQLDSLELIPEGLSYHKHVKSQRVHCSETEASHTECKLKLNDNYKLLGCVLTFKYPKCLHCFPNDPDRVRTREQAAEALDAAIERVREAKRRRT